MNTKIQIPTVILQSIEQRAISYSQLHNLKTKSQSKLLLRMIELWYYVYMTQISSDGNNHLGMYVNINKKELTKFDIMLEGNRLLYSDLLNLLECIIDVNENYLKGEYPKSYKINTDNVNFDYISETEIDISLIFKGLPDKDYWLKKYPEYKLLIETAYNTEINLVKYQKWLNENYNRKLKPYYSRGRKRIIKRKIDGETIVRHYNIALKIKFKKLWFTISDEGRFYSSISNMPNTIIESESLMLQGIILNGIDVVNCQPLLLTVLVNSEEYKKDCEGGVFYDNVTAIIYGDRFINGDKEVKGELRGRIKLSMYRFVFFNDKPLKGGQLYKAFEKLYPGLMSQINSLKIELGKGGLAKKLQNIESNIFVKGCIKFNNVLLRHDEVIIKPNDESSVLKKLRKGFNDNGIFKGKIKCCGKIVDI